MTEKEIEESHSVHCGLNATPLDGWTGPCDCIVKELKDAQARIQELEAGIEAHSCGISRGCMCQWDEDGNPIGEHSSICWTPFEAEKNLKALLEK